jgi:hypothetical protein
MQETTKWRKTLAWLSLSLLASVGVWAQEETGSIYVVVTDAAGTPLPGVTVEISGFGAPQIQVADTQGQARFLRLAPGTWSLNAALDGYSSLEYPSIDVRIGRSTSLEIQLSPAIGEVITVTSESPLLDERRIQSGTSISQIELETIPTARDPWSVLNQTPGVMVDRVNVGGNESGQQAVFVNPGVSDEENAFLVDGVEITDMAAIGSSATYYDFDQFAEMQFATGGSDVAKSNSGVSVNLVTKRGTNEFRGSARFYRTDSRYFGGALEQDVPVFEQPDAILAPDQESFVGNSVNKITEYGFEAGGPVLRDQLWFWGSFATNDVRNRSGGDVPEDVQPDDTLLENSAFKLNWQIASPNSFAASWNNGDKNKFGRSAGPTRPAPTTWDQRGPTAIYKFEDTHIFNSSFFLTGNYSKVDGGFELACKACLAAGDLSQTPETLWDENAVWQNSYLSGRSSRPSTEWKLAGSFFFNTGSSTSHELKYGGRLRSFEAESPFHWPGRDVFHINQALVGTEPFDMVVAHRGETPLITQDYTSAWVQDTITLGRWTINAGLRYDLQDGANEPFEIAGNPAFPELMPALSFDGNDGGFDWQSIAPRVGLTYALGEERKTLLRASFSQFAEQLSTTEFIRSNPLGDAYAYMTFEDQNGDSIWQADEPIEELIDWADFDPTDPSATVSPNLTDPSLDPPLTNEAIIGAEHSLVPEFVVGATITYRLTTDWMEERDLIVDGSGATRAAGPGDYVRDGATTGVLPNGQAFSQELWALNPDLSYTGGTALVNGDREVEYLGASINFVKRLSNQWMLRGFVNYGDAEWKIPSSFFATQDPNNFSPLDAADDPYQRTQDDPGDIFLVPSTGSGAKDDVLIQSSWSYNLNGMYQVAPDRPWGFNVAANLYGREGYPLPYYNTETGSDGRTRNIQITGVQDSFRVDDIFTVDGRLEKEFAASGDVGFTFSLDVFNIFDESTELQRARQLNSGQPNYLRETLSPRIWRLGVRLNWR